jgi:endonuclease YncB( thermonuclease family)
MSLSLARSTTLLLLSLGVVLTAPPAVEARSLYGTVTAVKSGELLTVKHDAGTYEVRIYGVDAPETGPFAAEAKRLVETLVLGKEIRVRVMTRNDQDEMVSQLLVDGKDVGVSLLEAGLALRLADFHYKPHAKGQPDGLVAAENEARLANRGIWLQPATSQARDGKESTGFVITDAVRAAGTSDTNSSQKTGNDTECAIAIDPTNPPRLFQSCNTDTAGLFAARSEDGGETWIYPDPADKTIADGDVGQGANACCDPTIAWDRFGNLYLNYLASPVNAVVTLLSVDGGATFTPLASFSGSVDQPTIVAANVGAEAHIWVVWNSSGTMVARGTSATALGTVAAFPGTNQSTGSSNCSFGDIAVGPTGVVVQVCENPTGGQGPNANLRMNVDADGLGAGGWGATTTPTTTNVGGFDFIPAQNSRSVDAEAGLAFDANPASPTFGRLYFLYTDEVVNEAHDLNILIRFSDDNGTSWSTPIQVNDDATTKSQFLPKLAIDPGTGKIGVCWHDARNSAGNNSMQLYCSTAEPATTPVFGANVRLSDGTSTSNGSGVEFGDYMGIAFVGGRLHPTWADTSNSTGNNPNGTAAFDAYSDRFLDGVIFGDGFNTGNTSAWSLTAP